MKGLLVLTMLFVSIGLIAQNNRTTTITCNNWLYSSYNGPSYLKLGDIDVSGNQITVEALVNKTSVGPFSPLSEGTVISKFTPNNSLAANYYLNANRASVSTTNGTFQTPSVCAIEFNKTYHVALTYDGSTLKFYRNGFLMSQIAATGTLVQNDAETAIAHPFPYVGSNIGQEGFYGYINEVRVWNRVRTQNELRSYMSSSLPSPTTTPNLLAYYTFDNLLNKQGNTAYNGTTSANVTINNTNPNCTYVADSCAIVATTAAFTAPDTVCVNDPVTITNNSTGATTYYWNFCPPDLNINPQATNLGNIGNILSQPSFIDFVNDNGTYYGFSNNYYPGKLVRLDFGNSLLNTPTVADLGNFGGIIPVGPGAEGIQVVKNEGKWYAFIVGGSPNGGATPRIIRIEFGASIINSSPTATNWGNIGNLAQPIDLMLFAENGAWYGLTVNSENNTVTRFNFTSSFNNTPTGTNLGNLGNLNYPTGLFAVNDNGVWRAFITNGAYNSPNPVPSITRLDFGNSLLNLPTAVNLGNPGSSLSQPRDITIFSNCGQAFGYVVDGTSNSIVKLNFNGNLQSAPVATSLGNIGNLSFPHSISKLFRSGADLYAFVTNINNNTITRLRFTGCTNSSNPSSTVQSPAPVTYTAPGTYTISLAVDEGMLTQSAYCKKVTVLARPVVVTRSDTTLCPGGSVQLSTVATGATTYSWSPTTGLSNASVASPIATPTATTTYIVKASNGYCQSMDTVVVNVNTNCNTGSSLTCNNWLSLPSQPAYATIGKLNITGNQVTCEALINRTSFLSNGVTTEGDVVSKHTSPSDVNYLLRPTGAQITTSNGFFSTPSVCGVQLNKVYHVAMTYDGAMLKFYRNGYLMSSVAATGNLVQNAWDTYIGYYAGSLAENFAGYINEVRIWNVARSQAQIRANMSGSLPNPTTQTGLQAYYTFDNLLNKQGNPAWNGTLVGSASINATTSACTHVVDSCNIIPSPTISNVINSYTPVTGFAPCTNSITVEDASAFKTGDTVLLIQMKGAVIDSTNTPAFGNITAYQNAGNYEFNYVSAISGNVVSLKNVITRQYTIPNGRVQLIRVPYFLSTTVSSTLTCLPWDGKKGGVLAFNVRDTLTLNADIDVSGKGFRGGAVRNTNVNAFTCGINNYYYPINTLDAAGKGESIYESDSTRNAGRGNNANGGGGGMNPNTGGGGGGNGNDGGRGGYGYGDCPGYMTDQNWGLGGSHLLSIAERKIYLGGGGGAGHCNNGFVDPSVNTNFTGGNGGGIIIINSNSIIGNNKIIRSQGNIPYELTAPGYLAHDGMGGGGAGGTILIHTGPYNSGVAANASGARGGNMSSSITGGRVGPGGGGGGGAIWVNQASLYQLASITFFVAGGANGVILQDGNNPYGATSGSGGYIANNLKLPFDTTLFVKNIDSVRIKDSLTICNTLSFKGIAYTRIAAVNSWQWTFGDGGTAVTQNTIHTYTNAGNYLVKLVVTDANGCKDSISKTVTVNSGRTSDFTFRIDPCQPYGVQFVGTVGSLPVQNFWSFGDNTGTANNSNPYHSFAGPGSYTVRYSNPLGNCVDTITKIISLGVQYQNIILSPDTTLCYGTSGRIRTDSGSAFCWFPSIYLNSAILASPTTTPLQPVTYRYTSIVAGSNLLTNGNFSSGNTGFASDYTFTSTNTGSQQYNVSTSAGSWLGNTVTCNSDHTTGTGNMLLVNGATTTNTKIWAQTVTVTPNTNYEIAGWLANLSTVAPAAVQIRIDGLLLDTAVAVSGTTCNWKGFSTLWNSGAKTSIELALVNISTADQGNDFAIDDISFAPVGIKTDSINITLERPLVRTGNDTAICYGDTARLQASGAVSYTWSPAGSLDNAANATPLAFPTSNTQYIVTGTTLTGCTAKDTVVIQIKPAPVITNLTPDTTICRNASIQLYAGGGGMSYSWQPAATLSNSSIANPVATPSATTVYWVKVTGTNSCAANDSVKVSIKLPPSFAVKTVAPVCSGTPVQLLASGGDEYLWSPATGLSSVNIPNPIANALSPVQYSVKIKETTCQDSTILTVPVNVLSAPTIQASRSNDISCTIGVATLTATGGSTYRWTPGITLSDSTAASPRATPVATTYYTVTGTGMNGCSSTDSVLVTVKFEANSNHYLPNAFTPNGDGLNDCFGIRNWGIVTDLQFSIYNRWGQIVFYTNKPTACWDGRYKNEPQQSGNFIYIIQAKTSCGEVNMKGSVLLIR